MPPSSLKTDSLAFSLLGAARAIAQVCSGTALPQALASVFGATAAPPQARGAMQDIAYRTMRGWGRSDVLLGLLTKRAPEPAVLQGLLACALTLLDTSGPSDPGADAQTDSGAAATRGSDSDSGSSSGSSSGSDASVSRASGAGYDAFTVVNQAVDAAAADPAMAHAKAMVNAVLRRFLRERDALLDQALKNPQAQWNYPSWWIADTKAAYPAEWQGILRAGNAAPPLTLRINRRRTGVTQYLAMLEQDGVPATQVGPDAVRLARPVPVAAIPGFADGTVSVQDAAAQMAAPLLDLRDGMRVLDACAAPGGKTGHILECADVDLLALDHDPARLERIGQNLQRLRLSAVLVAGDAADRGWWDGKPFDRILADVPCTASGVVRRHPDIRWLRRRGDAAKLATLSRRILDNLWQMLGPDGKLLFVTCSLWPHESEAQAAAFAARHQAIRLPAPGQLLPAAGTQQDHDGLFYALFRKPAV